MVNLNNWDLKQVMLKKIKHHGGWVNTHAHLDRAYSINLQTLKLGYSRLQEKWRLVDELKQKSTVSQIYDRMAFGLEQMMRQGVTAVGSFIDVDKVIRDKTIKAAQRIKNRYGQQIIIKFINQSLKGVLNQEARKWFDLGAEFVDIVGGLPGTDKGREAEHLDVVLGTAKRMKKMAHIHIDQLNLPEEEETELLVKKTKEFKIEGKVVAIHGISIAAHPKTYRQKLYQKMRQAQIMIIACPSAWIDHRRSEELMPFHNAVTPIDELIPAGITVALGTDNIADIYKPFTNGDMWTELRLLLEACHYYEIDQLVKVATVNGKKVLGL